MDVEGAPDAVPAAAEHGVEHHQPARREREQPLVARPAGQEGPGAVAGVEPDEAARLAARAYHGAAAAPAAEAAPGLEQLGAVELHGVVRGGRAQPVAGGAGVVDARAR